MQSSFFHFSSTLLTPMYVAALLVVCTAAPKVFAQSEQANELESRSAFAAKFVLKDQVKFKVEEQLRLNNVGPNPYDKSFTELTLVAKTKQRFKFQLGYRFIHGWDDRGAVQGKEWFNRYQGAVGYSKKIDRWKFSVREQFQFEHELFVQGPVSGLTTNSEAFWRTKFMAEWDVRNWKLNPDFGYPPDQVLPRFS